MATPIGNLGDISLRALAVLARADLIAAEDTRHSRKLLTHFGIRAELTPYHEHNAAKERPRLLARIRAGFSVALISDAGTPLISDPGYKLVREALDAGFTVTCHPRAFRGAGGADVRRPAHRHVSCSPASCRLKPGARRKRLDELKPVPATLVFFETAPRLAKSLADMAEVLGPREAAIAKELTKLHERVTRGTLDALAAIELGRELKGEFVVVIAPPNPDEAQIGDDAIVAALKQALEDGELPRRGAQRRREASSQAEPTSTSLDLRFSAQSATRGEREARQGLSPWAVRRDDRRAAARLKGHRILARRYKTPVGEIDLVALKGKRLAFVEVK